MRLIDADELVKRYFSEDARIALSYANKIWMRRLINESPTIDAEPVRHGHWIEKELFIPWCDDDVDIIYECSCCETEGGGTSPYCPNCGSKMDEEDQL